jgi:aspartyl-tRNA(Asn)/glutamyl-tRNA(Gln) amidotransferase subunit A
MYLADIFTVSVNLVGLPGISVPCGLVETPRAGGADRLPIGVQLVGRMFDETTMLRVADAFERTTDWHRQMPPL